MKGNLIRPNRTNPRKLKPTKQFRTGKQTLKQTPHVRILEVDQRVT